MFGFVKLVYLEHHHFVLVSSGGLSACHDVHGVWILCAVPPIIQRPNESVVRDGASTNRKVVPLSESLQVCL